MQCHIDRTRLESAFAHIRNMPWRSIRNRAMRRSQGLRRTITWRERRGQATLGEKAQGAVFATLTSNFFTLLWDADGGVMTCRQSKSIRLSVEVFNKEAALPGKRHRLAIHENHAGLAPI